MRSLRWLLLLLPVTLAACLPDKAVPELDFHKIDRNPGPLRFNRGHLDELPSYQPSLGNEAYLNTPDLRGYDLSALDLSEQFDYLLLAMFDDKTIWPSPENLPSEYDIEKILAYGKDPGLGVSTLHDQGVTGHGVGIAIIDQILLADHIEYRDQLRLYEELDDITGGRSSMHGAAVVSIAVGKTVGVAPDADLYYIATHRNNGEDFSYLARGIERLLEINAQLPAERKIRVITMQIGWGSDVLGYGQLMAAIQRAQTENILVISSSLESYTPFKFHGLGRSPLDDPDDINAYTPGYFWSPYFFDGAGDTDDRLLVPMDSRTLAGPTSIDEYAFYFQGGWSWAIPYIAGVYALAAQIDPEITPEVFWELALQTGAFITLEHEDATYELGPIIDPIAIISALKESPCKR